MPIHEDYEDLLRQLRFVRSQDSWYYPGTALPHLHVTVESPQMNGGRVASITGTRADHSHVPYMVDGVVTGTTAALDAVSAGWGDKAEAVLSLEVYR